tara:strand:- start:84837 stop:85328 length:492 start_codon:yes stop_codon:yes gene_type:complete
MRHKPISALIAGAIVALPAAASADGGYFSNGDKQLVIQQAGKRSSNEKIALYSLLGATVVTGAVGTYYLLDSQSISNDLSASGLHTLRTWDAEREDTRLDGERSGTIATVTLGISGAFAAATLVTFIITRPDTKPGYQDWQTQTMPSIAPTRGGLVMTQGWSF